MQSWRPSSLYSMSRNSSTPGFSISGHDTQGRSEVTMGREDTQHISGNNTIRIIFSVGMSAKGATRQ